MKTALLLFISFCFLSTHLAAQTVPDISPADRESIDELLEKTIAQTKEHQSLARLLGKWRLSDIDPQRAAQQGEAKLRSVAFGSYIAEELTGKKLFIEEDFLFGGPQVALVSHAVYGFDPLKQKYTATWYTNFNAIPCQGEAEIEPEQNRLNFRMSHPLIAKKEEASDPPTAHFYRITFIDANQLKIQVIETVEGRDDKQLWGVEATKDPNPR
jgi:hypothetical protein